MSARWRSFSFVLVGSRSLPFAVRRPPLYNALAAAWSNTMSNLILTSKEVQELEKRAFAEGVSQEGLMDSADSVSDAKLRS